MALFGTNQSSARGQYRKYVEKGIALGKRPELTGDGLIRSLGGWGQAKALRRTGTRLKSDERILGDSAVSLNRYCRLPMNGWSQSGGL